MFLLNKLQNRILNTQKDNLQYKMFLLNKNLNDDEKVKEIFTIQNVSIK